MQVKKNTSRRKSAPHEAYTRGKGGGKALDILVRGNK